MAPITTVSFTRERRRYDVRLSLDDRAIMEDRLVLEVTAAVTDEDDRTSQESLTLELDLDERQGTILHNGERWHSFSLTSVPVQMGSDGVEAPPGMEADPSEGEARDGVADFIEREIGLRVVNLIDVMPVADPIVGCALKAGISSALGQTLVCNEMVGSGGTTGQRVWRVVRCLRDHVGGIFTRTLWRTARCIVSLGVF